VQKRKTLRHGRPERIARPVYRRGGP
jgi:hypothetical protein